MIRAALTGCAAALVVLSGCSSASSGLLTVTGVGTPTDDRSEPLPTATALAKVVAAAGKTLRTSASITTTVRLTGSGTQVDLGPLPRSVRITGAFDFRTNSGLLTAVATGEETGSIREIFRPRTVYITNLPNERAGVWVTVSRPVLRAEYLYRTAANDPRQMLDMVAGAEEMALQGRDTIAGAVVTRYRGYLSAETLTQHLSAAAATQADNLLEALGPQARRIEAWVDAAGRIVRVRLGFDATQGDDHVSDTVQLDLTRFAAKVKVALPPARDRVPVHHLIGIVLG